MSEWQTIDSAPKDKARRILLLRPRGQVVCGNWNEDSYAKNPKPFWDHDLSGLFGLRDARVNEPTHWMPLPQPPEPA